MKQGLENESPIFKNIPTLLSICEFVSEKLGEPVTPVTMVFTVELLKGMFYKGNRRKKKGNRWGCKGKS